MPLIDLFIIFGATFIASLSSVFVGGGSFITLPVLFLLGVNPKMAIATNYLASVFQFLTSGTVFWKSNKIKLSVAKKLIPAYIIGGIIGAFTLIEIDANLAKNLVAYAIIFFAILSLIQSNGKEKHFEFTKAKGILGFFLVILTGIYAVLITASAGTIMAFVLVYLFGLSFKKAITTRTLISPWSIFISGLILLHSNLIDFLILIPLGLGRLLGGYVGAHMVLATRGYVVKIIFNTAAILLAAKVLFL